MELAYALVVLVGAPYTTCEEFLCEGCALYGLTVPGVSEAIYDFGEFLCPGMYRGALLGWPLLGVVWWCLYLS